MRRFVGPFGIFCAVLCLGLPAAGSDLVFLEMTDKGHARMLISGEEVLLVPGQPGPDGVKLISVTIDKAVVRDGHRVTTLRAEAADDPAGSQAHRDGKRPASVTIAGGMGGHHITTVTVNGVPIRMMVDTGASQVALTMAHARTLGINLQGAPTGQVNTANGVARVWLVKLFEVRLGELRAFDVPAVILDSPLPHALLGQSFLSRFNMRSEGYDLVIEAR
jgi:aspartyl protease family protein